MTTPRPTARTRPASKSPAARHLARWFAEVDDWLRQARVHGADAPAITQQCELLVEQFAELVEYHAPLVTQCSPLEVWLRDELVIAPPSEERGEVAEHRVPFLLFRDGIRGLTFDERSSRGDARTLLAALLRSACCPSSEYDVVTHLWEADLAGLSAELAPLEQVVPAATTDADAAAPAPAARPPAPPWLGAGAPAVPAVAWAELQRAEPALRRAWGERWAMEAAWRWPERAVASVRRVLAADDGPATRESLGAAIALRLGEALQRCDWTEAAQALDALRHVDPDRHASAPALERALARLDARAITAQLDETDRDTLARFGALVVRLGPAAIDFLVRLLECSGRARVRATTTTALGYVGAEDPQRLTQHLRHPRWYVARNVTIALGHVGGEEIASPLVGALRHPDPRVRRAAVTALAQVPVHKRTPLLVAQLDAADAATQELVFDLLAREADPRARAAVAQRIAGPGFADRPEAVRVALVGTLGEIGDEHVVPVLEELLNAGGWLARRSPERTAAARALARLRLPAATDVLRAGLNARAEAVRAACEIALAGHEEAA